MSRARLAARQHAVLDSLLRGSVPAGFDARSAALTIRVLQRKRWSDLLAVAPELRGVDDAEATFLAWAAKHPGGGRPPDDALEVVMLLDGPLPEPLASIRRVEGVYRRRARAAVDRRPGHRRWVVGVGGHVLHVGPRNRR